ncbi:hypothetical protein [Anaerosinus massiliensis]|uniref:hypothetical protein n=1 Tax=Massilibacillus massiliensis TaxID=1806837 RepID=UPI000DA5F377|nr:hypothetical protein [Massilibacillus massiliensis]
MIDKDELIKKYKNSDDYWAVKYLTKIVLYDVDLETGYVFGATIPHHGEKIYFVRHLDIDDRGYLYFPLHQNRHYQDEFEWLRTPPTPPDGYA